MAIPSTWQMAHGNVRAVATERRGTAILERYHAPQGTTLAEARAVLPWKHVHAGESGPFAARLQKVDFDADRRDRRPLVGFHWLAPTVEEVLEERPDHVLVEVEAGTEAHKPDLDLDGEWVWHREYDQAGQQPIRWEPIRGRGIQLVPRMKFRTRLARDYDWVRWLKGYTATVNWAVMTQYASCRAGTLLLTQWARHRAPSVRRLYIYDTLMVWEPLGWNNETDCEKYVYRVYDAPIRDAAGNAIEGRSRTVGDWYATGEYHTARFYPEAWWGLLMGKHLW